MTPGLNLNEAPEPPDSLPHLASGRSAASRRHPSVNSISLSPQLDARRRIYSQSSSVSFSPSIPEGQTAHEEEEEAERADDEELAKETPDDVTAPNRRRTVTSSSCISFVDDDYTLSPDHREADDFPDLDESSSMLFGCMTWPEWLRIKGLPTRTQMASALVQHAPCFWCNRERHLNLTSRSILLRLIMLDGFFGLLQVASASYLLVVLVSKTLVDRDAQVVNSGQANEVNSVNLWNVNANVFFAGLLGAIVLFSMLCARKIIREVMLVASLRLMWVMMWILPLEIYVTIIMFDIHGVTEIWVKHYWSTGSMAWFRSIFCEPETYNTLCVVPIDGLPSFTSEDAWCSFYCNSTACTDIRNEAQAQMIRYSYYFYNINGIVGILTVLLLSLTVNLLEGIITKPIVQKSRESNVPLWLTFPIIGCFVTGSILLFAPTSVLQYEYGQAKSWPGVVYLIAGGLYLLSALVGWFVSSFTLLSPRDKQIKSLGVILFIGMLILTLCAVVAIFVSSIFFSINIVDVRLNDQARGHIACSISSSTCSYCGNDDNKPECPEWTKEDVSDITRTTLKQVAALAGIFMLYSLGALRFGFVLRKHLAMYQIDFV